MIRQHTAVSSRRPRVLVAIEAYRLDGPIRNLLYAVVLLRPSVDYRFVTFVRPGQEQNDLVKRFRAEGLDTVAIPERGRFDLGAARQFRQLLEAFRPDVVQVHHTKSRLFAVVCARLLRAVGRERLLFFFHGETWTNRLQSLYNMLDRRLFCSAGSVVVVSEAQTQLLRSWGVDPARIAVIVNAIPESPPRAPTEPGARPLRLMTAGRFSLEKGHRFLIEAVALLPPEIRQAITVDIFGDGPEGPRLRALITQCGLGDVVYLRGYRAELGPEYLETDLFVLPSLSEGLPNVLLEAAMAGVPIVSTAVGGVPSLFDDAREARLVPPGDAVALANAIRDFVADPVAFRPLAERARQHVIVKHGPRAKADALMRLYTTMAGMEADG